MSRNVCTGRVTYKPQNVPFFINPQFKNADLILLNLLWQDIADEIGYLTMEIITLPLPPAGKGEGEGGVRIYPPHLHLFPHQSTRQAARPGAAGSHGRPRAGG